MHSLLIVGGGGVGRVVAHKCAQIPEVFSLPSLAMWASDGELKPVRRFGYQDFKSRLS